MLPLEGSTGPQQLGTFTNHKLFASKVLHRGAMPCSSMASGIIHKTGGVHRKREGKEREDGSEDEDNGNGSNIFSTLPPLLTNAALVKAVSETKMATAIEEWGMPDEISEVYKLLSILMEPPPDLDLDALEGLPNYLSKLLDSLLKLPENGVRRITSRCWWLISGGFIWYIHIQPNSYAFIGLCHRDHKCVKHTNWKYLLDRLEISRRRIINWCPTIKFPIKRQYPRERGIHRIMLEMFFNPNPLLRLRIVPIKGE